VCSSTLNAQIETFRNVNNGDGLIDWQINSFYKDNEGFLWAGGTNLVQRFDGRYVRLYKFPDEISKVNAIAQSKAGLFYVATSNGLYTINQNDQQANRVFSSQIKSTVFAIYIDNKDNIYLGTENGLSIISGAEIKSFKIQNKPLSDDKILSSQQMSDGKVWLFPPAQIASFIPKTEKIIFFPSMYETGKTLLTKMAAVGQMLYIGTNGSGIYAFNTQKALLEKYISVGDGNISCLSSDGESQLYVGTVGTGVYFISLANNKVVHTFDSSLKNEARLTSSRISALFVDKQKILWVGNTESLGFDFLFLKPKAFVLYKTPSFSTDNLPIHGLYIGKGFKLLSNGYGVYYVSDKDGTAQFFENGIGKAKCLKSGDVFSFHPYKNNIILGGQCGIYSFSPAKVSLEVFEPFAFLKNAVVYHINSDAYGNLWVATSKGLHVLNASTQKISSYTLQNSNLIDNEVHYVYFDRSGRTWVCTKTGVCFWNEKLNDFKTENFALGFIDKELIHFMMEDMKGNLLFCYRTKQAFVSDPDLHKFRQICSLEDADFTGNWINKILQDKAGTFWFVGSRGTIKANETLTEFQLYSITEGLMEPYATDGSFDSTGKLWLSNNKGLYYSSDSLQRTIAPMVITDVKINGASKISEMYNSIKAGKQISLKSTENNIEIQFALLTYDRPDLMVYECKLNGSKENWDILRGINSISYKDLKPGKYSFIVRRNMDHTCFSEISFEISPIISTTQIILIIVILLGSMGVAFYWYIKLAKRKISVTESLNEENGPKYQFNKISDDEAKKIIDKLKNSMEHDKYYLNQSLKMPELAKAIGCSNQTLSQVFNLFMNDKYYDFINRYRIDEFKRIISETDYSNFTLKALSEQSGFSSYTSFFRTFKDQTGITPNEFIQQFESGKS